MSSAGKRAAFLQRWQALADYCLAKEPNTLTYEASLDKSDPDTLFIYERYVRESDLTGVHNLSQPFKQVRARDYAISRLWFMPCRCSSTIGLRRKALWWRRTSMSWKRPTLVTPRVSCHDGLPCLPATLLACRLCSLFACHCLKLKYIRVLQYYRRVDLACFLSICCPRAFANSLASSVRCRLAR
jgi:quinol monooxygenase YgiN